MKVMTVAASSTGLRPTRSLSAPIANIQNSIATMLMVLISRACAGAMPSTVWIQLTR